MTNDLWNRVQQATKAKKYLYVPLVQEDALRSDRSYLRIFIAEMYLESRFAWFKTWYPAVSVGVQLRFGDQEATIVSRVVKPPEGATKDGVLRNYQILPLTPFNGGTVQVQAALLAMQGADYLGTAIDVLQDFSSLVAPPFGQTLAIAEKVANGLDSIMDATNGNARLPYHDTFVGKGMGGNEIKPGYLAIIRAEPSDLDPARLSVSDGRLFYAEPGRATPGPFRLADYMLLRIDGPSTRDDYMQLTSIADPYNDFVSALERVDLEAVTLAERSLQAAVLRCADLARFDRPRVWKAIADEIADLKSAFGITPADSAGAPPKAFSNVVDEAAMAPKEARFPTLDEIISARAVSMGDADSLDDIGILFP